jgi:phage gp36-like protein
VATLQTYCTQEDVEALLSEFGVLDRLDDDQDGTADAGLMTAGIAKASADVNQRLLQRYDVSQLLLSDWVKYCTAHLATAWLCRRRGLTVPEELAAEVKTYLDDLKRIRDGHDDLSVNDGLALPSVDSTPTVSNMIVDGRYRRNKVRRVPSTSSGQHPAGGLNNYPVYDLGRVEN